MKRKERDVVLGQAGVCRGGQGGEGGGGRGRATNSLKITAGKTILVPDRI